MAFTSEQIASVNNPSAVSSLPQTPQFDPNASTMQAPLPTDNQPDYLSRVGSDISSNVQAGANSLNNSENGSENPILAGLDIFKNVTGAVASPITEALNPVLQKTGVSDLFSTIGQASQNNALMQKITTVLSAHPDLVQGLDDSANGILNMLQIEGGIEGIPKVADAVGDVANTVTTPTPATPSALDVATQARDTAAQNAVTGVQNATESVEDYKNDLGTTFRAGAQKIEDENPDLKLTLTPEQMDALNTLKNNKSFALPDYLNTKTNPLAGTPKIAADIENGGTQITPTQAQDLITQLNRSTFVEKSSGLGVDQSKIGLTNDIKNSANDAFDQQSGGQWSKLYSDYSQGRDAINKISDIITTDKNPTASDMNKTITTIQKLGSTPEGKLILQNAIQEFKNTSGIDLSDPVQAVHQIADKQMALQDAQKGGYMKQMVKGAFSPSASGRLLFRGVVGIGILYPMIRAIEKAATSK